MPTLTLEDIARQTGVSRSTVSRVLNNHPSVREEVRQRVLAAIEASGYQPHAAARTLASKRSFTIGLILPQSVSFFFTDPYYPHLIKGIAQACNQHDYTLALFLVGTREEEEKIFPRISGKGFLDGVLIQSGHHGDQWIIGRMLDIKMPVVVCGRPFRSDNVSYIDVDNIRAAHQAVSHLIRLGRQRIATITGPFASTVGLDRLEGYKKALQERGLPIQENLIVEGDFTEEGGYYAMQRLLPHQPDAVFAASDLMALGAIRAAKEAGLRVPEQIAFVGFDDFPLASSNEIRLTTIRQPVVQFGIQAVELLIDLIEHGHQPPRRVILDTELIIRDTCGAARRQ
ncbi:MAG: LacI family transcriptional regulator [Anaerolineales bacterium]|nr:LacI family transcriptional regulator [Anaerolineales bacterium]MCX7608346.1 LacI family transcriptional regulator [Anaerolineales bacterium]MDW8226378.1 LacI family DNA-binding transcriptional regulator [Anaerolineales bacterium]